MNLDLLGGVSNMNIPGFTAEASSDTTTGFDLAAGAPKCTCS